jgi:hypothetical protein
MMKRHGVTPVTRFVVVQEREYRLHRLEVHDRGRDDFTVIIVPPPNRGEPREMVRAAAETLGDMLNRAKAEIDAVMGPKPPPRFQRRG